MGTGPETVFLTCCQRMAPRLFFSPGEVQHRHPRGGLTAELRSGIL